MAFLVSDSATQPDLAAIESSCRRGLASFKIPKQFHVIPELPRNAMGKVQKNLLADLLRQSKDA